MYENLTTQQLVEFGIMASFACKYARIKAQDIPLVNKRAELYAKHANDMLAEYKKRVGGVV